MKYIVTVLAILFHSLLYAQVHSYVEDLAYPKDPSGTVNWDFEDTTVAKKYRLHTVKKYIAHHETDEAPFAKAKYEIEYTYVFDKNGRRTETIFPNDGHENDGREHEEYYRSLNYETDSFDANKHLIQRKYVVDGTYAYKEWFVCDSSGNVIRTFSIDKNNNTSLENASQYNAKGDIVESFWNYGPYNINRWVFQYNEQGKQVSKKGYKYYTELSKVDSASYDAHGNKTSYYNFNSNNDQLTVTEHYTWTYDNKDNLISENIYHSQAPYSNDTFLYDKKQRLIEKRHKDYNIDEVTSTTYSYYTSGMVKEIIGYKTISTNADDFAWAIKMEYTTY